MSPSELQAAVEREIARYHGSLDLAVEALRQDADAASWGAPVHEIYKAAAKLQSEQRASMNREAA
jgi:hypothetical protein